MYNFKSDSQPHRAPHIIYEYKCMRHTINKYNTNKILSSLQYIFIGILQNDTFKRNTILQFYSNQNMI